MCMDFTNLNKNYPKDNFPFSLVDQLVDDNVRYVLAYMAINIDFDDNKPHVLIK